MVFSICQLKKLKSFWSGVSLRARAHFWRRERVVFGEIMDCKRRQRERNPALHCFACQLLIADLLAKRA